MVFQPSPQDFLTIFKSKIIPNCPINSNGIRDSGGMFDPGVGLLEGLGSGGGG